MFKLRERRRRRREERERFFVGLELFKNLINRFVEIILKDFVLVELVVKDVNYDEVDGRIIFLSNKLEDKSGRIIIERRSD